MTKISKDLNKAILHSLAGKYSLYVFQILSLAVLSRLFTPKMFGILATVQILVLFFQLIANSGLAPAIVFQEKIENKTRNGLFSFTIILGFLLSVILCFAGPALFDWLSISEYGFVAYILSFSVFFSAISMVPVACLQKDKKFLMLAQAEIYSEVIAFIICLVMYFSEFGFLALALKFASVSLLRFIFYYQKCINTKIGRPKFGRNIKAIFIVFDFLKFQFLFNILNFFSRNLDSFLIAKYFGVVSLGFYEKSYQVMKYPLQLFTFAITPALQPVLTNYKDQPKLVEYEFYRIIFKLAFVGVFVSFNLFWSASEVLLILFGEQWLQSAPILSLLAVSIPLQMVLSSTGGVFHAMGKTKELFICGLFSSFTSVTAIILGIISEQVSILCLYLVFAFLINFLQCLYVMHKHLFLSPISSKFFIVLFMLLSPYINLFFFNSDLLLDIEYFDALISILKVILVSTIIQLIIYFSYKNLYFVDQV